MTGCLAQAATAGVDEGTGFFPILLIIILAAGFAFINLIATSIFGPSRMGATKGLPYESGVDPVGDTHQPFVVQYYLVALLFLVFDVELVFLYPWSLIFRESAMAGEGYTGPSAGLLLAGMGTFLLVLVLGFAYEWKNGVLDWQPRRDLDRNA